MDKGTDGQPGGVSGGGEGELHVADRRLDLALEALAAISPGAVARCLRPVGVTVPPSGALRALLPSVHWIVDDIHPLSYVDPSCHASLNDAWFEAAQNPSRLARGRLRTMTEIACEDGTTAPTGWYELLMIDLVGHDDFDVVVTTLVPSDDLREPLAALPEAWGLATGSFRIRLSPAGEIVDVTSNVEELTGRTVESLIGTRGIEFVHPDDVPSALASWREVLMTPERSSPGRVRLLLADGTSRWFDVTTWNGATDVTAPAITMELRDVHEQVEAEHAQRESNRANQRLLQILDDLDDIVMVSRFGHGLVYANRAAFERIDGLRLGSRVSELMTEGRLAVTRAQLEPYIQRLERWAGDVEFTGIDGLTHTMSTTVNPVVAEEDGEDELYLGIVMRDATADREHAKALSQQARRDPLTGLPNRLGLMERLESLALSATAPDAAPDLEDHGLALCFIDIDNLKTVNDGLGHGAGDRLLVAVADQLRAHAGESMVARFGGDEFVVLADTQDEAEALTVAEELLDVIGRATVTGISSHLSASIGVAVSPCLGLDPEAMLRDADAAMYQAKHRGRARVAVFDDAMREQATRRFVVETSLRQAIREGTLDVHLQPVATVLGELRGFEALARWGLVEPAEFVATAEEAGMIVALGQLVFERSLAALVAIRDVDPAGAGLQINVNVSGRQLADPGYADRTLGAIAEHGLQPTDLVLELTESVLIDPVSDIDRALRTLRDAGVSLALDDFGSGYSSMSYLRRYPIQVLKLDTSYTQALPVDPETRIIAEAIVTMARRLGIRVVAEGVETREQFEVVREMGIRGVQGFLIGMPRPVEHLLESGLSVLEAGLDNIRT
jgi:diguanylate cyclase (GGDEF)-like protein/PAS domain S-box-containing protein